MLGGTAAIQLLDLLPRLLPLLTALAVLPGSLPALAVPRLDLRAYPPPAAGTLRWVIQLPGVLPPSSDPSLSPNPADWRVELLVGQEQTVDCNLRQLQGEIQAESVPGWGYSLYRVLGGGTAITTRMACPAGVTQQRRFISLSGPATFVPYNASLPIVVDAPRGLQVRWRLWKAERRQQQARQQP